jgi:calcium/calmodulin-dependent protein kinase I
VKLHEVWEQKKSICLVLDLMSGGELFDRVVEKESFTEQEAAQALLAIAEATRYCHSLGVVHRDLKVCVL